MIDMKATRLILTSLFAVTICITAAAQLTGTVHVHDNSADGTVIPKEIYGQFSEHLGRCIYDGIWVGKDSPIPNVDGYRLDVLNALKELKVPVLRWPGGCFADDYHWMDGIGPQEKRTSIANNTWGGTMEDNSFGTHEFLNLCELLGCEPYISGNVGSGSVEELAKWVEYMNSDAPSTVADMRRANGREEPWHVKYLGIGNEAWGCGGDMTPEYYSDLFKRYATYLRSYKGEHLLKVASGASDYDYNWTEVCMKAIGSRMSAIAVHYYSSLDWNHKGQAAKFDNEGYYTLLAKAVDIENCIRKHISIMDRLDPDGNVDLFVDEWGTWWDVEPGTNPGHLFQQNTMRDAMMAAMTLNIFHKYTRRIKMANIAQVVNVLQSMVLTKGDRMVLTPTYHVFNMYKVHQDAEFIPVETGDNVLTYTSRGAVPELSASASRKDGVLHVSLANPSLDKTQTVKLDWDSFRKDAKVSATVLCSKDIHDFNDFGKEPRVAVKPFTAVRKVAGGVEIEMPAASVVVLEIK